jgi:hypothetical protein
MRVFLRPLRLLCLLCPLLALTLLASAADVAAGMPGNALQHQVDTLIESALPDFAKHASPLCSDAEFLRRVTLDLTATIPSSAATRRFLADTTASAIKRARLIDRLLASPAYARRMQYLLDWILMERRTSENVRSAAWQAYLRQAAVENRPWDQLAHEILVEGGGGDSNTRPRARFYLDREFDLTVVTRDVGRIFLGKDLECAQCHNHPVVDAYLQRHYYGLKAFLDRSYVFTDPKSKKKSLGEKAEGDVTFTSAFDDTKGKTSPRILDLAEIIDPDGSNKQYVTKPGKSAGGVPRYSRRRQLGIAVTAEQNRAFRLNIANRLWAAMMGRGLVEPLDLAHAANPPSHPELLGLLGDQLHDHGYDMKWFLGQLARTRTYQRSSLTRDASAQIALKHFGVGLLKPLSPEQYAWAAMEATGLLASTRTAARKKLEADAAKAAKPATKPATKPDTQPATKPGGSNNVASTISAAALETAVDEVVAVHIKAFVTQFAAEGGQKTSFSATAPQALFLVNGTLIRDWLKPTTSNLTGRLSKLDDQPAIAEELYIGILNRPPTPAEQAEVIGYLAATADRSAAITELTWALLLSAEFRFNH